MIAGILLAAGASRRFGGDKLLAEIGQGRKIAALSCAALRPCVDRLIAVVRPGAEALSACLAAAGAELCVCPDAEQGMGASLACGVRQAPEADGWLIALADMPFVATSDIERIVGALRTGAAIAVPMCGERRGHPVGFSRHFFAELTALNGDAGARGLLATHAERIVAVGVEDLRGWHDIDTRADLAEARSKQNRPIPPATAAS